MTTPTLYANTELVIVAWFKEVFGNGVAGTTLPAASAMLDMGFALVTPLSGASDPYVGMVHPVVSIDTWAPPKANKPPWNKANNFAEAIRRATLKLRPHKVVLPGGYPHAQLYTAQMLTEPRRVPDPGHFARYNFNIAAHWAPMDLS